MPRTAHASPPGDRSSGSAGSSDSSSGGERAEGEWRARCDRCGDDYTLAAWTALPKVAEVEPAWLATHLTGWRADQVIEVRRCASCGASMSRRRPVEAPGDPG